MYASTVQENKLLHYLREIGVTLELIFLVPESRLFSIEQLLQILPKLMIKQFGWDLSRDGLFDRFYNQPCISTFATASERLDASIDLRQVYYLPKMFSGSRWLGIRTDSSWSLRLGDIDQQLSQR